MHELLIACVALVNLPYTLLIMIVVLYWTTVILGVVDSDLLGGPGHGHDVHLSGPADGHLELGHGADLHADAHVDGHIEASVDAHVDGHLEIGHHGAEVGHAGGHDVDAHAHHEVEVAGGHHELGPVGFFTHVSHLFSIGEVPITVFISFFAVTAWSLSIIINHTLQNGSMLLALGMAIPLCLVSFFLAKIVSFPFRFLFRALNKGQETHRNMVGQIVTVLSSKVDQDSGQAELKTEGAPMVLYVRTKEGVTLKQGDQALIILHDHEKGTYLVQPYNYDSLGSEKGA